MKFHLTSKNDHLKGNWYEWFCQAELPDGTLIAGTVQADGYGEGIASETFEPDEEHMPVASVKPLGRWTTPEK